MRKVLIFVIILAVFLRFFHFGQRFGIGSDDMRDISIAKEAIIRHELPLIGSFSSAGPFVFGPIYYWFLMGSYLIFPFSIATPWFFSAVLSVVTVFVLFEIGNEIDGEFLGLIMAFLAAISPQLVYRALGMSQHSFIPLFSSFLVLSFIKLWENKDLKFAFFGGMSLGIALSMHFQAINLFVFFPAIFLISSLSFKQKLQALTIFLIGFLIPSLPNIIWDSHQQFANTGNLFDYLLIGQYRLYVPNSWKLFILDYLPTYWAFVIGGIKTISLPLIFFTFAVNFYLIYKKKLSKTVVILFGTFIFLLFINKFYHGERSEGYLMYFVPFVILFSSLALKFLLRIKPLFVVGCVIIALGSLSIAKIYTFDTDRHVADFNRAVKVIENKYKGDNFSVYDYDWQYSDISYGFMSLLAQDKRISDKGIPIGIICESGRKCIPSNPPIFTLLGTKVVDLRKDDKFLAKKDWGNVNQNHIYDDLMQWQKNKKLKSSFNLVDFLFGRFRK